MTAKLAKMGKIEKQGMLGKRTVKLTCADQTSSSVYSKLKIKKQKTE